MLHSGASVPDTGQYRADASVPFAAVSDSRIPWSRGRSSGDDGRLCPCASDRDDSAASGNRAGSVHPEHGRYDLRHGLDDPRLRGQYHSGLRFRVEVPVRDGGGCMGHGDWSGHDNGGGHSLSDPEKTGAAPSGLGRNAADLGNNDQGRNRTVRHDTLSDGDAGPHEPFSSDVRRGTGGCCLRMH